MVEPEEIAITRQRHAENVSAATDMHATIEELLKAALFMRSDLRLYS
jgi:hypothetical protein